MTVQLLQPMLAKSCQKRFRGVVTRTRKDADRNQGAYSDTHQVLIATAVRIISQHGAHALSVAAVAREMGIDRTTVYYHFSSREALLADVKAWSTEQMAMAFSADVTTQERVAFTIRYALEHPELMKLWIDDFLSGRDVRESYPHWDAIVEGLQEQINGSGLTANAEIVFLDLLTNAIIAPRVYRLSINAHAKTDEIVQYFQDEHMRILAAFGIDRT
jgi:AcrR family transcriptional regulator